MRNLNQQILEKARQLSEELVKDPAVSKFKMAEQQINKSEKIANLIQEIKYKQKELVHAKHYRKPEYKKQIRSELDKLNKQLDETPLVKEYQLLQVEVNSILQMIQKNIADIISEKIDIISGGKVLSGCGSGKGCGCKK